MSKPQWFIEVNTTVVHHAAMTRDDPQMKIRLPAVLKDRVVDAASANGRTMNAEIVLRLEQSFSGGDVRSVMTAIEQRLTALERAVAALGGPNSGNTPGN